MTVILHQKEGSAGTVSNKGNHHFILGRQDSFPSGPAFTLTAWMRPVTAPAAFWKDSKEYR